jgi:hypothetical protein
MASTRTSWILLGLLIASLATMGGAVLGAALGAKALAPIRTAMDYSWPLIAQEAQTMNRCVSCHEPDQFHTCRSCHDDHGSAELASVPFSSLLALAGDIPEPTYIAVNDILPYRDQPNTHVALLDLLAEHGVAEFETVTLTSQDGGFVTFAQQDLTAEALLMPHVDGIRFAAENLHVSTWLKGVERMIVVGRDKPLRIDGQATSIGRLLVGPTRHVTVEQADVMLKSRDDGQVRRAKTAGRLEGAPIEVIVADPNFARITVHDERGQVHALTADEAQGAVLAQVRGRVVLVLPERGQPQWIEGVVEIASE